MHLLLQESGWAAVWAIFSQTHLVTLFREHVFHHRSTHKVFLMSKKNFQKHLI
jgi:hypothetical protein